MSTMDKMITLLRQNTLTVTELMARLNVTRNAVIVPLRQLESQGFVASQARREARVGKPALEYFAVPGYEDKSSLAYQPFASLLVETLKEDLDPEVMTALLRKVGQKMANDLDRNAMRGFSARLKLATDFADQLGAETLVEDNSEGAIVRSHSCPLGSSVRRNACVCKVMAAFFQESTGARVEERCQRGEKLVCEFLIEKDKSAQEVSG